MAKGRRTVLPLPDGSPERLEGGYKNELLRYGDLVLRLTRAELESVEWEHRLLETIDVPEAVAPVAGPQVWDDGRIASLFPFVPGAALDRDDAEQRARLARIVAATHRTHWEGGQRPGASSWLDRDLGRNAWWDWEIVEKPAVLVAAYDEAAAFLADPPPLRIGVVHGDVHPSNVRVAHGRVVGVIDWAEARLDWLAAELANAAWVFGRAFVDDYVDAGGPAETEHLEMLVRLRNLADVLYSLTSKARGERYSQEHVDRLLAALA